MGFLQQILYSVQAIPCNHRGVGALSAGYWQMLLYHLLFWQFWWLWFGHSQLSGRIIYSVYPNLL